MPREPRRQSESGYYHIYARGSGRQIIYEDNQDRETFMEALEAAVHETGATLYAYALMGNHYHLVVQQPDFEKLPTLSYELNRTYATYFNRRHDHVGHLLQDRYSSQPINGDAYFLAAVRYVHRNPVEAHMTHTCNYIWSSYSAYLDCTDSPNDGLVETEKVLDMLGGVDAFQEFHAHPGKERFADDRTTRAIKSEETLLEIARTALSGTDPLTLKTLPKPFRNESLRLLRAADLTLNQIALITGIARSTVQRIV